MLGNALPQGQYCLAQSYFMMERKNAFLFIVNSIDWQFFGWPSSFLFAPPPLFSTAKGVTSSFLLQYGHYCNAKSPVQGDPLSDIGPHLFIIIVK